MTKRIRTEIGQQIRLRRNQNTFERFFRQLVPSQLQSWAISILRIQFRHLVAKHVASLKRQGRAGRRKRK